MDDFTKFLILICLPFLAVSSFVDDSIRQKKHEASMAKMDTIIANQRNIMTLINSTKIDTSKAK